jgi:hypothetical protein
MPVGGRQRDAKGRFEATSPAHGNVTNEIHDAYPLANFRTCLFYGIIFVIIFLILSPWIFVIFKNHVIDHAVSKFNEIYEDIFTFKPETAKPNGKDEPIPNKNNKKDF